MLIVGINIRENSVARTNRTKKNGVRIVLTHITIICNVQNRSN